MAQHEPVTIFRGIILDSANGEALSYASVSLTRNGLNTLSNEEGQFIFKIPAHTPHDTIYISHIGYRSVSLPSDQWRPSALGAWPTATISASDSATKTIRLGKAPIQLPGVTVLHPDALGIIHKAIAKIPDNYPTRPYKLTGFYRVTSQEDRSIVEITEGIFNIVSPDNERQNDEFRLIKARADRDLLAFNGAGFLFGRKPNTLMNFDLVSRIHQSPFLGDTRQKEHDFHFNGLIDYEGRTAYEIVFDQKDSLKKPLYKGRIIIDTTSLAFLFFEYGRSPKGLPYVRPETFPPDTLLYTLLLNSHVTIRYALYGSKYYLNHVHTVSNHHTHKDGIHAFDMNPLEPKTNYLITRIDTGAAAFKKEGELISDEQLIEEQIRPETYAKPNFWENYNLIEPDFNIDSALAVIRYENEVYVKRVR
jgi:CarboxypepD_reg-like domain